MKITILYGGKSGEHEVSLVSAANVVRNIDTSKHFVNLIGIDKDGKWYWQEQTEIDRIKEEKDSPLEIRKEYPVSIIPGGGKKGAFQVKTHTSFTTFQTDIVFPVLHGTYGEDGTIQGLLEMAEVPYVGCTTMSSSLTMDKEKTKVVWTNAGLPVVPYHCVYKSHMAELDEKIIPSIEKDFSYPVFVKPCCAGSSVGASKANNRSELKTSLYEALKWDDKVLVEKFIPAREIECSVMGNDQAKAYGPGEIAPKHEFYDYDAKYTDPNGADLLIPAKLDENMLEKVREMAVKAYQALDASGLSRVDFFISKEDGQLLLNEINTMPGFTEISMFPKMCAYGGIPYSQLIEDLCQLGIEKFESRRTLQTSRS
ncbi:MAG: D-alanine--D-alanine ligase [Treponemataceae bacterium]|nr:D-alanine--D-alanine ligase [Treponemataceae bacterium]